MSAPGKSLAWRLRFPVCETPAEFIDRLNEKAGVHNNIWDPLIKKKKKEIKILCAIPNYQMVVSNWYAIVTLLGKDPNTCAASRLWRPIRRTFTFE